MIASLRERFEAEVTHEIRREVRDNLSRAMRPKVAEDLRASLLDDAEFIEEARRDVQRKLLAL